MAIGNGAAADPSFQYNAKVLPPAGISGRGAFHTEQLAFTQRQTGFHGKLPAAGAVPGRKYARPFRERILFQLSYAEKLLCRHPEQGKGNFFLGGVL